MNTKFAVMLSAVLLLCLAPIVGAVPIVFTGNVDTDFAGKPGLISRPDVVSDHTGQIGCLDEPMGADSFEGPAPPPGWMASGFNIERVVTVYDCATDTLYLGLDVCDSRIAWDASGDGQIAESPAQPVGGYLLKEIFSDSGYEAYRVDLGVTNNTLDTHVRIILQSNNGGVTILTPNQPDGTLVVPPGVTVDNIKADGVDIEMQVHGLRGAFPPNGSNSLPVRITTLSGAFADLSWEDVTSGEFQLSCDPCMTITEGVSCSPDGPFLPSVSVLRGATVYFQTQVTNCGAETLGNVLITDAKTDSTGALLACTGCTNTGSCIPGVINVGNMSPGATATFVCTVPTNPAFSVIGVSPDAVNTVSVVGTGVLTGAVSSAGPVSASVNVLTPSISCSKLLDNDSNFNVDPTDTTPPTNDLSLPGGGNAWSQLCVTNTGEIPVDFTAGSDPSCPSFNDTFLETLDAQIPGTGVNLDALFRARLVALFGNNILPAGQQVCVVVGPVFFNEQVLIPARGTFSGTFTACGRATGANICLPPSGGESVSTGGCATTVRLFGPSIWISGDVSCSPSGPFGPSVTVLRGATIYKRVRITNYGFTTLTNIGIENRCSGDGACGCGVVPLPIITHDIPPGQTYEYLIPVCTNPAFDIPGISIDCVFTTAVTATSQPDGTFISTGPVTASVDVLVPTPIASLRSSADGHPVTLEGKVVTAGNEVLPGLFYVEDANRASGIQVVSTTPIWTKDIVYVSGIMQTNDDGERYILAGELETTDCPGTAPLPLGMTCSAARSGPFRLWAGGVNDGLGTNTVGLLVKVWGKVTATGEGCFYVSDGSKMDDGLPGLRVLGTVPVPEGTDPVGQYVAVTGISSCYKVGGDAHRLIRATNVELRER